MLGEVNISGDEPDKFTFMPYVLLFLMLLTYELLSFYYTATLTMQEFIASRSAVLSILFVDSSATTSLLMFLVMIPFIAGFIMLYLYPEQKYIRVLGCIIPFAVAVYLTGAQHSLHPNEFPVGQSGVGYAFLGFIVGLSLMDIPFQVMYGSLFVIINLFLGGSIIVMALIVPTAFFGVNNSLIPHFHMVLDVWIHTHAFWYSLAFGIIFSLFQGILSMVSHVPYIYSETEGSQWI